MEIPVLSYAPEFTVYIWLLNTAGESKINVLGDTFKQI